MRRVCHTHQGLYRPDGELTVPGARLSHSESRSLILNEELTCRTSSASGAIRIDTRPDHPGPNSIKLAALLAHLSTKRCYLVYEKTKVKQSETTKIGNTIPMSKRRKSYVSQPTKHLRYGPVPPGPSVSSSGCGRATI